MEMFARAQTHMAEEERGDALDFVSNQIELNKQKEHLRFYRKP